MARKNRKSASASWASAAGDPRLQWRRKRTMQRVVAERKEKPDSLIAIFLLKALNNYSTMSKADQEIAWKRSEALGDAAAPARSASWQFSRGARCAASRDLVPRSRTLGRFWPLYLRRVA